jgi:hypothetical protein
VPLCDNKNQGIVPVNAQLGDGMNLSTNLYWGAGYGVRSYFKLKTDWKLQAQIAQPDTNILERVVFTKTMNGTRIQLVADAYRGDRMQVCISDFLNSLAGKIKDTLKHKELIIPIHSQADLLIFNGHNGLMDANHPFVQSTDNRPRDAMVIACYSASYFIPHFERAGGYPLVMTTGLLAPEAYVMHAAIEHWALLKTDREIRFAAGDAYAGKHPSSSPAACKALFRTGWNK